MWFEAADEVALALEHWLLAEQPRSALRLLASKHSQLYDAGQESTIKRTIAAIPVEAATADLEAMLDFTWCHMLVNRRRFVELTEQLDVVGQPRRIRRQSFRGRVTILRSDAATRPGDGSRGAGWLARP